MARLYSMGSGMHSVFLTSANTYKTGSLQARTITSAGMGGNSDVLAARKITAPTRATPRGSAPGASCTIF